MKHTFADKLLLVANLVPVALSWIAISCVMLSPDPAHAQYVAPTPTPEEAQLIEEQRQTLQMQQQLMQRQVERMDQESYARNALQLCMTFARTRQQQYQCWQQYRVSQPGYVD